MPRPEPKPAKPDRSFSTKLAWIVLLGGSGLIAAKASVATVVTIHGTGMAPSIRDGDAVVLVRGPLGIERGDIVVYDPTRVEAALPIPAEAEMEPTIGDSKDQSDAIDQDQTHRGSLRNTAVVDLEEVEGHWRRVKREPSAPRSLRVGRVLALPGDALRFRVEGAALGLEVEGRPLSQKPAEARSISSAVDGENPKRPCAYEWVEDRRYTVFIGSDAVGWPGIELPTQTGSVELRATGYLILADNRDEGACCDSRVLGFIPEEQLRGEIVLRLAGEPDQHGHPVGPGALP